MREMGGLKKVQHQKGLSEAEFDVDTGARSSAVRRWSSGGGPTASPARSVAADGIAWSRPARFISAPRAGGETSLTAGTIFAATKLSLRSWFRALYHLTQSKQGISSLELGRRLGVTQSTAWTVPLVGRQVERQS